MLPFKVTSADSDEGDVLLDKLRSESCVALVGSVISDWEPSRLPSGCHLTNTVARILSRGVASEATVKPLFEEMAFEHLMEGLQRKDVVGRNLCGLYNRVCPNPIHQTLADLMARGVLEHVVTTNYDANLETACRAVCPSTRKPQVVVTEEQARHIDPLRPVIFKIHGDVTCDSRLGSAGTPSMVFSLSREGELPEWKRRVLFRLSAGRNLVISAYSGRDFEICSELPRLHCEIVWNCWKDPTVPNALSPNAERVLRLSAGTALVGDLTYVWGALARPSVSRASRSILASPSPTNPGLEAEVVTDLAESDIDVWRLRALIGAGCGEEAAELAKTFGDALPADSDLRFDALMNEGRGLFHQGLYRRAASKYRDALQFADSRGRRDWRFGAYLDLVEAERCAGHWLRAWRVLNMVQAQAEGDEWVQAVVALRRVLVLRHLYQLAKGVPLCEWLARRIRRRCRSLLQLVVSHAKDGHWPELQQAELWAGRLDIPFADLYSGPLNPLPSRAGYRQMGYLVAELMAIRDGLSAGQSFASVDDIQEKVLTAWKIGARAEVWKVVWTLKKTFGRRAVDPQLRQLAFRAWRLCEYTLPMRLFVTMRP